MLFNSLAFAIFLPIVFILYWALPHKVRWVLLFVASYYFYMSWDAKYVVLILATTAVSYVMARLIAKAGDLRQKKALLVVSIVLCLSSLFFFKYFNFTLDSISKVCSLFSIKLSPSTLKIVLPVGISFYTFQTLAYLIDVYRGVISPEKNFGIYATFISFFPLVMSGPIERGSNLLPQFKSEKKFEYDNAVYGLRLMAWGFFKKLAIADVIAVYVDSAYNSLEYCTGFDLILAVFFFTIQIYCDFSGYSDIAIGTAKLLGINLMTNFKSPYFSFSVKEFWGRWHISLSTWFRDYVYIPLGGNRCSTLKRNRNLLITFLLSGLWHGANWTFVVWGGLHGLVQSFESTFLKKKEHSKAVNFLRWLLVFAFCNIAWVFFRADTINDAGLLLKNLGKAFMTPSSFLHTGLGFSKLSILIDLIFIAVLAVFDYLSKKLDVFEWIGQRKNVVRWAIYFVVIFAIIIRMPVGNSGFLYFQF